MPGTAAETSATGTPDELAQLRDAAARHVMGWTLASRQWAYSDEAEVWHDADGAPVMTRFSWRPDEDARQAMALAERLVEQGVRVRLDLEPGRVAVSCVDTGQAAPLVAHSLAEWRVVLLRAAVAVLVGRETQA